MHTRPLEDLTMRARYLTALLPPALLLQGRRLNGGHAWSRLGAYVSALERLRHARAQQVLTIAQRGVEAARKKLSDTADA